MASENACPSKIVEKYLSALKKQSLDRAVTKLNALSNCI